MEKLFVKGGYNTAIMFYDGKGNAVVDFIVPSSRKATQKLKKQLEGSGVGDKFTATVSYCDYHCLRQVSVKPSDAQTLEEFILSINFLVSYLTNVPEGLYPLSEKYFNDVKDEFTTEPICIDRLLAELYDEHENMNLIRDILNFALNAKCV